MSETPSVKAARGMMFGGLHRAPPNRRRNRGSLVVASQLRAAVRWRACCGGEWISVLTARRSS